MRNIELHLLCALYALFALYALYMLYMLYINNEHMSVICSSQAKSYTSGLPKCLVSVHYY